MITCVIKLATLPPSNLSSANLVKKATYLPSNLVFLLFVLHVSDFA